MILYDKTLDDITKETMADLEAAGITNTNAGDAIRILLAAINKQMSSYYTVLRENHLQAYVSTANADRLDLLGQALSCERYIDEHDEDYRFRITKQVETMAAGNYMAVYLAALSAQGVQEVLLKEFTHGTGSFSVFVITADTYTSDETLENVREKIREAKALGVRAEVYRPEIKEVEVKLRLTFNKNVEEIEKGIYYDIVRERIQEQLNSMEIGQELDFSMFEEEARRDHRGIIEFVDVFDMRINGRPVLLRSITPAWNERFVEATTLNAVMVI